MIQKDLLAPYSDIFSEYTELRAQENRGGGIALVNGDVMSNNKAANSGVSARVYKHGVWGFASHPEMTDAAVRQVVESATRNAQFLDARQQRNAAPLPAARAVDDHDFSTQLPRVAQSDLMEFLKVLDGYLVKHFTQLHSRTLVLRSLDMEKALLTSDGTSAYSMIPRTLLSLMLTVEKDGEPVELYNVYGGFGQFEDNFLHPEALCDQFDRQYEHLLRKTEGIYAESGMADCILDADLAGILAHEAIGHTTEADLVLGGSIAGEYLGEQVASPLVTLIDFAHTAQDELCPVPVFVDDEGTQADDAVLIENGVLKGFLHNKETANHFKAAPTGNARAYDFSDEPLIRMRNTVILPGESSITEMISSIDDGYYLMKPSNGQADSTSEFMFGVVQGYKIKHGRLQKALKDLTISGVAFDMLKTVSMVSDDMVWKCGGMCGKKQMIPVAMGGPALKCRVNIGGK